MKPTIYNTKISFATLSLEGHTDERYINFKKVKNCFIRYLIYDFQFFKQFYSASILCLFVCMYVCMYGSNLATQI